MRQEKKYLLNYSTISNFENFILSSGYRVAHNLNVINNIYYDNSNFNSLIENINGDMCRSKFRLRWYNNTDKYILEEKCKVSSSGFKKRHKLKSITTNDALNEAKSKIGLIPVVQNIYLRRYYINNNIRITVDTNLKYSYPLIENFILSPHVVVEIKYDTCYTPNISLITDKLPQLTKFSKYVDGCMNIRKEHRFSFM